MNSLEDALQGQLQRQSEPFDALWACRTGVSEGAYLAPLRTHALRVLRLISSALPHAICWVSLPFVF